MNLTCPKPSFSTRIFLVLISIVSISNVSAQNWQEEIIQKLSLHQTIHHSEKVFVQTDRPIYLPGETIWFNAFVINSASQELNQTVAVLHVELLKPDKSIFQKEMFKIENGLAAGQLELKENTRPGKYYLVAYTNWMRNAGSEFYFSKEIIISGGAESFDVKASSNKDEVVKETESDLNEPQDFQTDLQIGFYPEGGDLVVGISSKVAFEVRDALGMPQNFNGMVVDSDGQIVTVAKTMWRGKGVFTLTPQPGMQYFIKETSQSDSVNRFPLPNALSEGLVMTVVDQGMENPLTITISKSGSIANNTLFLLATQNGEAKDALIINMSSRETLTTEVAKTNFNSGIVQLTLFDSNQMARAERLVFIKKEDALKITINEDKLPEGSRDSVLLTMLVTSRDGEPVEGNFSIAVTDAVRVPDKAYGSANINQYLSLYSDLPGLKLNDRILFEDSSEGNFKLELLMLTNGWRRYQWEEVLSDTLSIPKYLEEPGIYVKGKVTSLWGKDKVPKDADVTMIAGNVLDSYNDKLDENGEFTFIMSDFYDSKKVVVQTKNRKDKKRDYRLDIKTSYQEQPVDRFEYLENVYSSTNEIENVHLSENVLRRELSRAVIEDTFVINTDKSIEEVEVKADNTKAPKAQINEKYGEPDGSIGVIRIQELMKEKPWCDDILGLIYDAFPSYRGFKAIGKGKHREFIFVDGELIWIDGDFVEPDWPYKIEDRLLFPVIIDPKDVRSVELLFPKNSNTNNLLMSETKLDPDDAIEIAKNPLPPVVLSIYTKSGEGIYSTIPNKGISNLTVQGFKKTKEFYHYDYSTTFKDSVSMDKRNTLAWYPTIKTDNNGKVDLKFYSSDVSNKIRLEINGISNVGEPGSLIYQTTDSLFQCYQVDTSSNVVKTSNILFEDGRPVDYASISSLGGNWSTFTSIDGFFEVDEEIINESSKLHIEKAGYQSVDINYSELIDKGVTLQKAEMQKVEMNAVDIIKKVYRNRFENRNSQISYTKGAYREKLYDGDALHQLKDYAIVQTWTSMREQKFGIYTKIYGQREFNSIDVNKKINFKPLQGGEIVPEFDPAYKLQSFLDLSLNKDYEYTLIRETEFLGRKMYHIQFNQKEELSFAYFQGELFVDAETCGLAWAKWRISDRGQKYITPDMYVVCNKVPESFEVLNENREMTWRYNGEIWEPDFAIYIVSFALNGEKKRFEQEITWKAIDKDEYKQLKSAIPKDWRKTTTLQKDVEYNPSEWRDGWMLPPDKNITEQIKYLNEIVIYEE